MILLAAYASGYFPMPNQETEVIEWYRPDPRAILPLDGFHVSRSLRKTLDRKVFKVTFDRAFKEVMLGCAARESTWINEEFLNAYTYLHKLGSAHSVEVWKDDELVGGVYGVSIGSAFFAESKFHKKTDASKVALYSLTEHLKEKGFKLLEVQFLTDHLKSLGAIEIAATQYEKLLKQAVKIKAEF